MPKKPRCMRIIQNFTPSIIRSLTNSIQPFTSSVNNHSRRLQMSAQIQPSIEVDINELFAKTKLPTAQKTSLLHRLYSKLRYVGRTHVCLYFIFFMAFIAFMTSVTVLDLEPESNVILKPTEKVLILLYTHYKARRDWGLGPGDSLFKQLQCPVSSCSFTTDQGLMDDAPVVLFHIPELKTDLNPPARSRYRDQAWVFYTHESPAHSLQPPYLWQHAFNWSMTYHPEAEIHFPYGRVYPKAASNPKNYQLVAREQRKMVAWFSDDCKTQAKREAYIDKLQKVVPVDMFGKCGDHQCDNAQGCLEMVGKSYKFYLSFETSLCEQFVTTEFFRHARLDVVPIVRGGANYSVLTPKNSYISTDDFHSPEELGRYLTFLSSNHEEYAKYLEWKNYFQVKVTDDRDSAWCDLCEKAHDVKRVQRRHNPYEFWFQGKSCWNPKDV